MFKIPDWDDDTGKSIVNFAKRNKRIKDKTTKSSANHATENIPPKHKHDNVTSTKNAEKNLNQDVNSNRSPRKRKHDKIENLKKKTKFSDNDVMHNNPKIQHNNNTAKKKKRSEEYLNLDILNAADEALMNEKKKQFDDEIKNVDQEDLLFDEIKGTTSVNEKSKCKNKKKPINDASPEKQNDFSFTMKLKNKKNQINNANHSELNDAVQRNIQKKGKKIAVNQTNGTVKVRNSFDKKDLHDTKKVSKKQTVNEIKKKKDMDIIDASSENQTNVVLFEKKPPNYLKKEKLKKVLQANRGSIRVTGNALRERMLERLKAAQFRYLNEKLYTSSGSEAQQLFQSDPSAFEAYHQGYQQQLKKWPVNPLDIVVQKILKMPKSHIIADMGCGEAALSRRVPHPVRSFDLVGAAPGVQACDMARTPLDAGAVHACVYCLALMGTHLTQYLIEANRVLKHGGQLLIAEVESRFNDVDAFIRDVERLGFKLKSLDKSHSVFFFLQFQKTGDPPVKKAKLPVLSLNPCLYKKR